MLGKLTMNTRILTSIVAAAGLAVGAFVGTAVAGADPSPETTISVQSGDGSAVDDDGTQGQISAPLIIARPQIEAAASTAKDRP